MTDQDLLQGLREHNPQAVEAVYSQVRPGIISYVKENSGTKDEAADLVQEAMVVVYIKATEPDFELTAALSTFVHSIAKNLWLKHLDRYKKRYKPDNTI